MKASQLLPFAAEALRLKAAADSRYGLRAVAKAVHSAQYDETESAVTRALEPFFEAQIEDAAEQLLRTMEKGGPGSGDWGHSGRPGQVGGSGGGGSDSADDEPSGPYGLSSNELKAIKEWSWTLYRESAQDDIDSEMSKKQLRDLDSAMEKLPPYQGRVYRTMVLEKGQELEGFTRGGLKVDEVFTAHRPLSTSKSKSVATDFAIDTAMKSDTIVRFSIQTKTARDISKYVAEEFEDQQEVIARPGSRYVVDKVKRGRGEHGGKLIDIELREANYTGDIVRDAYLRKIGAKNWSKSISDQPLSTLIFQPNHWNRILLQTMVQELVDGMVRAMTAQTRIMGKFHKGTGEFAEWLKASTASEWLQNNPVDDPTLQTISTPYGEVTYRLATEYPKWVKQTIRLHLEEAFAQPYWIEVNATTLGDINKYLKMGAAEGWSIEEIARNMTAYLLEEGKYAVRRGRTIARTEVGHALNGARSASIDAMIEDTGQQGMIRRVWLSVLGNTTRDSHANLDGVPAGPDGKWPLGGVRVRWPADVNLPVGERANCQCTVVTEMGMTQSQALQLIDDAEARVAKGGPGSGDWGHSGRPGQVGGSGGGGGHHTLPEGHQYARSAFVNMSNGKNISVTLRGGYDLSTDMDENFRRTAKWLIGSDRVEDVVKVCGVPDGSHVRIRVQENSLTVSYTREDIGVDAKRMVTKDNSGNPCVINMHMYIHDKFQGKGLGSKIFASQVENASSAGLSYIETHASGPGGGNNGYYTWPRLGYDAEIPFSVGNLIRKGTKLSDQMKTPEGRKEWKQHGQSIEVKFDLSPNSQSRRVLDAYVKERFGSEKSFTEWLKGGPGSGDWGHSGRPGQVGGSGGGGGHHTLPEGHQYHKPKPGGGRYSGYADLETMKAEYQKAREEYKEHSKREVAAKKAYAKDQNPMEALEAAEAGYAARRSLFRMESVRQAAETPNGNEFLKHRMEQEKKQAEIDEQKVSLLDKVLLEDGVAPSGSNTLGYPLTVNDMQADPRLVGDTWGRDYKKKNWVGLKDTDMDEAWRLRRKEDALKEQYDKKSDTLYYNESVTPTKVKSKGMDAVDTTPDSVKKGGADKEFKDFLGQAEVAIALQPSVLDLVVKDGRLKNTHERGSVGSPSENEGNTGYKKTRRKRERDMFGEEPTTSKRPIYGFLEHPDRLISEGSSLGDNYGHARVILKPSAKGRTTYTIGDSLDDTNWGALHAGSVVNPASFKATQGESVADLKAGPNQSAFKMKDGAGRDIHIGYVEAQIHGGVRLGDIAKVQIPKGASVPEATRSKFKEAGVEVEEVMRPREGLYISKDWDGSYD